MLFLHNRAAWHSKYVLGIYDQQTNPAALTGTAFHKYMELILKMHSVDTAYKAAQHIITNTDNVNWGITGSVEKSLSDLNKFIDSYEANPISIGEILAVEKGNTIKAPGIKYPIKAYADLVHTTGEEKTIHIVDWKTTRSLSDTILPAYRFQAVFYYWWCKGTFGRFPEDFTIVQIKGSKNKDGSPGTRTLTYVYSENQKEINAVKKLTQLVIREMNKKKQIILPNLRDDYEGEAEWTRFVEEVS